MDLKITHLPLIVHLFGVIFFSMLFPSAFALSLEEFSTARSFFYSSILGLFVYFLICIATSNREINENYLNQLFSLVLSFFLLPIILAIPMYETINDQSFLNCYLDMVSSMTTTGFVVFDPKEVSIILHFWRALVAWLGGALMLGAAIAILAPMRLGGEELVEKSSNQEINFLSSKERKQFLKRSFATIIPIYTMLTLILCFCLYLSGLSGFDSLIFAMSVLSTSGIEGGVGLDELNSNWSSEIIIFIFLLFAISRPRLEGKFNRFFELDYFLKPEFRLGCFIIIGCTFVIFFQQWISSGFIFETIWEWKILESLWGNFFTITSLLTTTGWHSNYWHSSFEFTNSSIPTLLCLGLVLIGGGVATTAGGVKILRIYSLYLNASREVQFLIHPSSVGGIKGINKQSLLTGAYNAWLFFMLFFISLAVVTLCFSAGGLNFEGALLMSISALSTTGPLIDLVSYDSLKVLEFGNFNKIVLCFSMILGKLEVLVILSLFNPNVWNNY